MPPVRKIRIKGFKSIRELELELRNLNVLIGANGAGKSNFISMFTLLHEVLAQRLGYYVAQQGGASRLLYFGRKRTQEIAVRIEFEAEKTLQNMYELRLTPDATDGLFFSLEKYHFWDRSRYTKPWESEYSGHKEAHLIDVMENDKIARYIVKAIQNWRVYQFHDTGANARMKQTGYLYDNEVLHSDAANLAAFLYRLRAQYPDNYRSVVETIKLVAPFFGDFVLRPIPPQQEYIRLEWQELGSDEIFSASMLSDGTLRFICLATLLLQPNLPETIIIDEPELGLHPFALVVLADMLRSIAQDKQVIISTQSVPLVNQFTPEDVIVVDREDDQSVFKRLHEEDYENWLDDYGLGDLWEKNVLGGRP